MNKKGEDEYKNLPDGGRKILHLAAPVDRDSENGLVHIAIKIENDKKLILKEVEKLVDFAQKNLQGGIFKPLEKSDEKHLRDHRLLTLCDLLLFCNIEGYQKPNCKIIKKLIFDEHITDDQIKKTFLKRAERILKPHYFYMIRSRVIG